jgi:hypothetical protein
MTKEELCNFFINRSPAIREAISTGAGWEVWLQVDFILAVRQDLQGYSAAREVPYPYSSKKLDLLIGNNEVRNPIEIKVESANKSAPFGYRLQQDVLKIKGFFIESDNFPLSRMVVGIGYSPAAKGAMQNYADQHPNSTIFRVSGTGIGVLVRSVVADTD